MKVSLCTYQPIVCEGLYRTDHDGQTDGRMLLGSHSCRCVIKTQICKKEKRKSTSRNGSNTGLDTDEGVRKGRL